MKIKVVLFFELVLAFSVGSMCAGCTPQLPLSPEQESSKAAEYSQLQEEESADSKSELSDVISAPVENKQPELEASLSSEQAAEVTIWKDTTSVPIKMNYSYDNDSDVFNYKCEDSAVLDKLVNALKQIKVTGHSEERFEDDSYELTFNFKDGSEQVIFFEHGGFLKNNKRYNIEDFDEVKEILDMIKNTSIDEGTAKSYDEWVVNISKVSKKISILCGSEEYENADIDKKRQLALELLKTLEKDGLIESGSIFASDNEISYQYKGGGIGAIMLKDFDPMMN